MTASNVDRQEVEKFERLASRWWDEHSEFKPLHQINPLRLDYVERFSPVADRKVLDVGCGGGIFSESMAARGADVTGIDMGQAPLAVAELHLRESGLKVDYRKITAEQLALSHAESFDIVTCMEMLEHVPEPASVIEACSTLVRPGGWVYFSTINRNHKAWLLAILGAEYVLKLLPKGTHDYQKFIRPSELGGWCRHAGLTIRDMIGMHYNPVFAQYRLGPGVDVNYMLACKKHVPD